MCVYLIPTTAKTHWMIYNGYGLYKTKYSLVFLELIKYQDADSNQTDDVKSLKKFIFCSSKTKSEENPKKLEVHTIACPVPSWPGAAYCTLTFWVLIPGSDIPFTDGGCIGDSDCCCPSSSLSGQTFCYISSDSKFVLGME